MSDVRADREHALPPGHRVGTHHGVHRFEYVADVIWGAAWLVIQLETLTSRDLTKVWLRKGCRQRLQELLVSGTKSVVGIVSRGPEGI